MKNEERLRLPQGYWLDESDIDIVVLRRPDGTEVAAFSAWGATREAIEEIAMRDRELSTSYR